MSKMSAEQVVTQLRQERFRYRRPRDMQRAMWFATELPVGMPIGNSITRVLTQSIPITSDPFQTLEVPLTAWMSFRLPRSLRYADATAFIALRPCQQGLPTVRIEWLEPPHVEMDKSLFVYGLAGDDRIWEYLCKGLMAGLQTNVDAPLADVDIQVLNIITHRVDSFPKAFEDLGQWLIEALGTKIGDQNRKHST